ncbi:myoglobin [Conger conger]|nr:myoglobin [Conger conger]
MTDFDLALQAFAPIGVDKRMSGGEVLTRLFQTHPETQGLFPRFEKIPPGELAGNAAVAAHGEIVLQKLSELLNAKGAHASALKPMGKTHATVHKIKLNNFDLITGVLVKMMDEKKVDKAAQDAFKRVMAVVITDLGKLYTEHGFSG